MKLHRQLVLLVLAALLPLVVLTAVLGPAALRQGQKEMERTASARVESIASEIDRELRSEAEGLQTLALSPELDGGIDPPWFHAYAQRLLTLHPLWMDVTLSTPQGVRLMDEPLRRPGISDRIIDLASHQQAVRTRRPVVGRVMRSPRGLVAFAIFVPVIRDGKVVMVVNGVVRPTAIRALLTAERLPAEWRAGVVDRDHQLVTRSVDPDLPLSHSSSRAIQALANSPVGIYRSAALDKTGLIVAYRVIQDSGWSVHVAMPQKLYEAPARRALWLVGGGSVASLLLMALFLGLLTRDMRVRQREAAALEESRRLEALGRITGGVAHDFNNILMIVQGSAELLRRRIAGEPRLESLTEAILAGAQRGQALTRQLLAVGRRSTHEPAVFRLQDMANELLLLVQRTVPADITTSLYVSPDAWTVHADPRALEVALINLAVNARDAMPGGGRLMFSAINVILQKGRDEGTGLMGDFVALAVADTGVGIAEAHLGHVLEPFYTTKPAGKGTGLGLSQVYGFARQSGGAVTVRSKLGEGTTIVIYLPRTAEPVPEPAEPPPADVQAEGRVLLVEDNQAVAEAIESMLTSLGFGVEYAGDAASALLRLEGGEAFDLVLSDIVMDGMSGLELAKRLREVRPDQPIVLMTGYSEALAGRTSEPAPILRKPFGPGELNRAIARARARSMATVA